MTLTNKIVLMICLMMGTAMFINGLNNIMYEVGGVYIHSFNCQNNDPDLANYRQDFDFWNDKLGFNQVNISAKHQQSTSSGTYNGVTYQVPVFRNAQNGVSTTTAKPLLDDLIKKTNNNFLISQ